MHACTHSYGIFANLCVFYVHGNAVMFPRTNMNIRNLLFGFCTSVVHTVACLEAMLTSLYFVVYGSGEWSSGAEEAGNRAATLGSIS